MGIIGSIGNAIGGALKNIGSTVLKAVAPAATDMLKGAAGSFVNMLPLPSPLKDLATKLLGKGADALKGLADGGIDSLLQKLVGSPSERPVAGAPAGQGSTTPPAVGTAGRAQGA